MEYPEVRYRVAPSHYHSPITPIEEEGDAIYTAAYKEEIPVAIRTRNDLAATYRKSTGSALTTLPYYHALTTPIELEGDAIYNHTYEEEIPVAIRSDLAARYRNSTGSSLTPPYYHTPITPIEEEGDTIYHHTYEEDIPQEVIRNDQAATYRKSTGSGLTAKTDEEL